MTEKEKHDNIYPFKSGGGDLGNRRQKSKRIQEELGKKSLTVKQAKILEFIATHIDKIGFPPTIRQIANYFTISAKAAHDHIRAIAKKEYIRLFPGAARGMELLKMPGQENSNNISDDKKLGSMELVPLLGSIAAGAPILAEEHIESHLAFPKAFLPVTGNMFALTVKGESMIDAGIFNGDIAVIKQVLDPTLEIKNGDIVAALIDTDATLKTYQKKSNKIVLHPENKEYQPIVLNENDDIKIMGILVGVYRKY